MDEGELYVKTINQVSRKKQTKERNKQEVQNKKYKDKDPLCFNFSVPCLHKPSSLFKCSKLKEQDICRNRQLLYSNIEMIEPPEIKGLPQLVQPYLDDGEIISYTSRYLTKPGDNYGSLMIAVTAKIKNQKDEIVDLPLIAKLPPITNDCFWNIFQPERTCLTENAVYKNLESEIRKLQLEMRVDEANLFDCFAKYYGSRISLNPNSNTVDHDAVLVLENLITSGYRAGDRHNMFDFAATKLIITELAKFHALSIGLSIRKPKLFKKKISPYFQRFKFFTAMDEEAEQASINSIYKGIGKVTNHDDKILARVKRVKDQFMQNDESPVKLDSQFVSIIHRDLWVNNVMLKYDDSGVPYKLKFVDFQISQMDHVVNDIIFFLFSSVDTNVLEQSYNEFLELYHKEFINTLQSVGISEKNYKYNDFLAEVHSIGPSSIWQALYMAPVIFASDNDMPDDFRDLNAQTDVNEENAELAQKFADIIRLADKFQLF